MFKAKNIQYSYKTDFNGDGEYHGILKALYGRKLGQKDKAFGIGSKQATFDWEGDHKIHDAHHSGTFNPLSIYAPNAHEDCQQYAVFMFGWYFMLCRCKEIANLKWEQIKFGEFESGKDKGKKYVQVDIDWDKIFQLSLTETIIQGKGNKAGL